MPAQARAGKQPAQRSPAHRAARRAGRPALFFDQGAPILRERRCSAWTREFRWGGGVFRWRGVTIHAARGQMVLGAVLENGWGEDELAVKLGRVLDLNRQTNGLERQLVGILAETLADEPDGSVRIVARALARKVVDKGVSVKTEPGQTPQEALLEAFCWYLGVDGTYGWQEALPSADSLRPRAERWVEKVKGLKRVWPSQAAAIGALVLQNASPREARAAARAAFAAQWCR